MIYEGENTRSHFLSFALRSNDDVTPLVEVSYFFSRGFFAEAAE
jgi:hypothetical protein